MEIKAIRLGVISGGQTGVDQAALRAAERLGIPTGGLMPRGWWTEAGSNPEVGRRHGLVESHKTGYGYRTRWNASVADATLLMGDATSAGSRQTMSICRELRKPIVSVGMNDRIDGPTLAAMLIPHLPSGRTAVLNVAGNRESVNPGIGEWAEALLFETLKALIDDPQ